MCCGPVFTDQVLTVDSITPARRYVIIGRTDVSRGATMFDCSDFLLDSPRGVALAASKRVSALLLSILFCSTALAQASSEADAYFSSGEVYLQSKQYSEAIKEFRQAIKLRPKWPEAYFKMGLAHFPRFLAVTVAAKT